MGNHSEETDDGIDAGERTRRIRDDRYERGKEKMVIIGAAMRKLLYICYGVLKNQAPFDASLHPGT
jgi:hypothetical protein